MSFFLIIGLTAKKYGRSIYWWRLWRIGLVTYLVSLPLAAIIGLALFFYGYDLDSAEFFYADLFFHVLFGSIAGLISVVFRSEIRQSIRQ